MNKRNFIYIYSGLLLVYLLLALILPSDPEVLSKYSLTQTNARMLNLTIVLPITAIYLTALYGFLKFRDYTKTIIDTREGPFFRKISIGLMFLAFSLPINSIIGSTVNYAKFNNPDLYPGLSVTQNYLSLILALIGFSYVAWGAEGLYRTLKKDVFKSSKFYSIFSLLGPIIVASLYTLLITSQAEVHQSVDTYNLPIWLVVLTVAVPYVYVWCLGVKSVLHFYAYKQAVKGTLYKSAFSNLSKGFAVIISVSVLIQIIVTLSQRLNRLDLTPLLAVIYLLLILYAVGYIYIAYGSKKLNKIEEV